MSENETKRIVYPNETSFDITEKEDFFPQIFNETLIENIKSFIKTNPKDTIVKIDANKLFDNFHIANQIHYKEWVSND